MTGALRKLGINALHLLPGHLAQRSLSAEGQVRDAVTVDQKVDRDAIVANDTGAHRHHEEIAQAVPTDGQAAPVTEGDEQTAPMTEGWNQVGVYTLSDGGISRS